MHEEGRATYENSAFQYEFFIKDHLGNVRQVVRAPQSTLRMATMEPEKAEEEEELFDNIRDSRQGASEHNKTPGGYATAWLNADRGRILGPSRSQEVQQGDSVEIGVFGKYVDPRKTRLHPASFIRTGANTKMIQQLTEFGQNLRATGPNELAIANVIALVITELQQKPAPEAYMGHALYDSDSVLYDQGKVVLSKEARNKHEELIQKLAIKKDGYIETYLVNETTENVWFDQFRIMSTGPLIVQETHYDPWGVDLSGLGYQYGGIKTNPYLYNGKELTSGLGVIMYDYGARFYIPAIGRWFVHDPLAEKARRHSPYNYALNNPMRFIDPDGMEAYSVLGGITVDGYLAPEDVNMPISPNGGGKEIQRKNAERAKQQQESRNRVNNEIRQKAGLRINENLASGMEAAGLSLPGLVVNSGSQGDGELNIQAADPTTFIGLGLDFGSNLSSEFRTKLLNERALAPLMLKVNGQAPPISRINSLNTTSKLLGRAAVGVSVGSDAIGLLNGSLTGQRFTYRMSGNAASFFTASRLGGWPGFVIGAGFVAGEAVYDFGSWYLSNLSKALTDIERGLKNGWVPGR